jgi:hypothetical protein
VLAKLVYVESKADRVKELRQEIADIQLESQRQYRTGPERYWSDAKERRIQRLQEITDELRSFVEPRTSRESQRTESVRKAALGPLER